ncbi:MAG: bifunctional pyr operon transcriptional regulator/uracil phosphoribosyltransferase PyrR [Candidatus Izemoplasmatales bacterium]|nr:bifunctional pyr operon transcriptional regulator/uracil phosphoribosyltransferase PyrR [Candidatus Izemoplasmatales bacterium]
MEKMVIDNLTMKRTIRRISYEIIEKNKSLEDVVLLGIRKKGVVLSQIIRENIKQIEGNNVPCFELDITPYRDDIETSIPKEINKELVNMSLANKVVILVDDVLFTGRTVRAAMDAVMDLGRPLKIELAILIDRGHRQIPVSPNYVGKNIPTSQDEHIQVKLSDLGEKDKVIITK